MYRHCLRYFVFIIVAECATSGVSTGPTMGGGGNTGGAIGNKGSPGSGTHKNTERAEVGCAMPKTCQQILAFQNCNLTRRCAAYGQQRTSQPIGRQSHSQGRAVSADKMRGAYRERGEIEPYVARAAFRKRSVSRRCGRSLRILERARSTAPVPPELRRGGLCVVCPRAPQSATTN